MRTGCIASRQRLELRVATLLVVLTGALAGCASASSSNREKTVTKADLELRPMEGKWYFDDRPFTGIAERSDAKGHRLESIHYLDGKKDGKATYFHPTGSLKKEAFFEQNYLVGTVRTWLMDGTLASEATYLDGALEGVQRKWHNNGELAMERHLVAGQEEGLQRAWLENGSLYVNYEAKFGRRFGMRRSTLCYELENENAQY